MHALSALAVRMIVSLHRAISANCVFRAMPDMDSKVMADSIPAA
jgi:hypothetical protein